MFLRKIESQMLAAVTARRSFHKDNTTVELFNDDMLHVKLHGNLIAFAAIEAGAPLIANRSMFARYPTSTTRSRLRALGFNASIRKGVAMLDGQPA